VLFSVGHDGVVNGHLIDKETGKLSPSFFNFTALALGDGGGNGNTRLTAVDCCVDIHYSLKLCLGSTDGSVFKLVLRYGEEANSASMEIIQQEQVVLEHNPTIHALSLVQDQIFIGHSRGFSALNWSKHKDAA